MAMPKTMRTSSSCLNNAMHHSPIRQMLSESMTMILMDGMDQIDFARIDDTVTIAKRSGAC